MNALYYYVYFRCEEAQTQSPVAALSGDAGVPARGVWHKCLLCALSCAASVVKALEGQPSTDSSELTRSEQQVLQLSDLANPQFKVKITSENHHIGKGLVCSA